VHDLEAVEVSIGCFNENCSLVEILVPAFGERGHFVVGLGLDKVSG
jgi:hypothetical protein